MPLSIAERKHLMPYGAQQEVAADQGVAESYVSAVMNGTVSPKTPATQEKLRRVQAALARKLGVETDEAFPPQVEHSAAVA